jgi:hypothetical protein
MVGVFGTRTNTVSNSTAFSPLAFVTETVGGASPVSPASSRFTLISGNQQHVVSSPIDTYVLAGTVFYTISLFVRKVSGTFTTVTLYAAMQDAAESSGATFNIVTGTQTGGGAGSITALPNGWFRITRTVSTAASPTSGNQRIWLYIGNFGSYNEDGAAIEVDGAQIEQASFASPYINTSGVEVTRSPDVVTWTPPAVLSSVSGEIVALICPYQWSAAAGTAQPGSTSISYVDDASGQNAILRGGQDTARRRDSVPANVNATAASAIDTSGTVRMLTNSWGPGGISLYQGSTLAANTPSFTPPWASPSSLLIGSRSGSFSSFSLISTIYTPGGLTNQERTALASIYGGRQIGFVT